MDAREQLELGITANIISCGDNYYAGLYAIETHLPVEIRQTYYTKESVDNCTALLAVLPCSFDTQASILNFTNFYLSVLRNCGLKKVGP